MVHGRPKDIPTEPDVIEETIRLSFDILRRLDSMPLVFGVAKLFAEKESALPKVPAPEITRSWPGLGASIAEIERWAECLRLVRYRIGSEQSIWKTLRGVSRNGSSLHIDMNCSRNSRSYLDDSLFECKL